MSLSKVGEDRTADEMGRVDSGCSMGAKADWSPEQTVQ
jgi:hypothetical protein